jgi:glycosidase
MQEYPNLNIVGEEWSTNPVVVSHWLRGRPTATAMCRRRRHDGLSAARHAAPRARDDESRTTGFNELYAALVNDQLYPEPLQMVLFEGNHDVPRLFSVLHEDLALYKMAIAYVLTMRGIPQLYYGTELLMKSPTQRDDGATRRDFPGGWAGDKVNGFSGAGLTASSKPRPRPSCAGSSRGARASTAIHRGAADALRAAEAASTSTSATTHSKKVHGRDEQEPRCHAGCARSGSTRCWPGPAPAPT